MCKLEVIILVLDEQLLGGMKQIKRWSLDTDLGGAWPCPTYLLLLASGIGQASVVHSLSPADWKRQVSYANEAVSFLFLFFFSSPLFYKVPHSQLVLPGWGGVHDTPTCNLNDLKSWLLSQSPSA